MPVDKLCTRREKNLNTDRMCCCTRLHRHQIHLISYGIVSCGLITTGLVFTVFAIFQKESQIGKVWLAGPTTMVVGLVLAGKVVIDWGPAMLHAREGSIDSRLFDQLHQPAPSRYPEPLRPQTVNQMRIEHEPKCNGSGSSPASFVQYNNNNAQSPIGYRPPMQFIHSPVSENGIPRMVHTGGRLPRSSIGCIPPRQAERPSPEQCLIYSQYNASLNKLPNHDDRYYALPRHMNNHKNSSSPRRSPRPSIYNTYSNYSSNPSNHSGHSNHSGNSHSGEQSIALSDVSVPCHCGVHVPQPLLSSV